MDTSGACYTGRRRARCERLEEGPQRRLARVTGTRGVADMPTLELRLSRGELEV